MRKFLLPFTVAALYLSIIPIYSQANESASIIPIPSFIENETQSLTLQAALERALAANPDLAVMHREVDALQGAIFQANTLPNPELATLVEDTRKETRNTTVQINQLLELGGKRNARVKAAQGNRGAAEADLNIKRDEIRAQVITAFYETLTAQERYQLAQASSELAKRAADAASKRVIAGKVSPTEETKAKIAASGVRLELSQAMSDLANARKRLAATWGSTHPQFIKVEGQADILISLPPIELLLNQLQQSPNFVRLALEIERRKSLVQLERSKQTPDVTVSLGVKKNNELGFNQTVIGVSIPLPLFDRNQGNLHEALSREDKARDEFIASKVRLENELSQIYEKLSIMYRETELLKKDILPGAKTAYESTTKGYELGKFGFLEVLDAQRTLFQAQAQYLRTLSDAHRARAEIERLVGPIDSITTSPSIYQEIK